MRGRKFCVFLPLLAAMILYTVATAAAADRVLMQAPKKDCAVVLKLPGFMDMKVKTYVDDTLAEGLIIRQSYIDNGKIVIPPSGLFYSSRCWSGRLKNDKFLFLGQVEYLADYDSEFHVLHDVTIAKDKPGLFAGGTKALVVQGIENGNGYIAPYATFAILKQSGNFYGTTFKVSTSPAVKDTSKGGLAHEGLYKKSEVVALSEGHGTYDDDYFGTSESVSGQSYVIASEVTQTEVKLKEFGTGDIRRIYYSGAEPIVGMYKQGEEIKAGDKGLVTVDKVGKDSVTVTLKNTTTGKKWTKTLGPITKEMQLRLPNNERDMEKHVILRSGDNTLQASLNPYNPDGVFAGGKVALMVYHDMTTFSGPAPMPGDDRFIMRLDNCASCSQLAEIMLENDKEIVLDADHKVFEGPNGYFKIVIDDFDGKTIKAWHIEDGKGNKTANLAERSRGKHIDALVNAKCRSVVHYIKRYDMDIIADLMKALEK